MSAEATLTDALVSRTALLQLGYRVLVLFDADKPPTPLSSLKPFIPQAVNRSLGARAVRLKIELFWSLSDGAIHALLAKACEMVGRDLVESHIASKSNGQRTLATIEAERLLDHITEISKVVLGAASRIRGSGWFKSISTYQEVARDIVGPNLATADPGFQTIVEQLRTWIHAA